jgi:hypothetical protein
MQEEINGGASSLLRTSLYTKFPVYQRIYREFGRLCRRNEKSDDDMMHYSIRLQRKFPIQHSREFF